MSRQVSANTAPRLFDGRMLILVLLGYGVFGIAFSHFGMPPLFMDSPTQEDRPETNAVVMPEAGPQVEPVADSADTKFTESLADNISVAKAPETVLSDTAQGASIEQADSGAAETSPADNPMLVLAPITLGALPADVLGVPGPIATEAEQREAPELAPPVVEAPAARPGPVAIAPRGPGEDAFLAAVEGGDLERVRSLLRDGSNANTMSGDGDSALMRATWQGHVEVVTTLIDAGADADYRSPRGITPLISAGIRGFGDIALSLLDAGANIDAASNDGRTALMAAAWNGHVAVVQVLLEKGASVAETDRLGRSALHYAAAARRTEIAAYLLAAGADPDQRDHSGSSGRQLAQARGWELGGSTR